MTAPTTAHKKAAEKLTWLRDRLACGMTVCIVTKVRAEVVTPKRWAESDGELFKIDSAGRLLMARGEHYDCIDSSYMSASAAG